MATLPLLKPSLPVARPPWTKLGKKLESMCRKALYEFKLLENTTKVGIALSGGKDSLTLLYLLKALSGRGFPELELYAFHVAGAFSCGASLGENFLHGVCRELDVPLIIKTSARTLDQLECYSCSRERRKLLFDAAKEVGVSTLAFGHHRDDSIETLVMNMLHKAEFAANLPKVHMHRYGITLIRPLLFISEKEIRAFASLYGFSRIVCQCPRGQLSLRKRAKEVIAHLEEVFPCARENLFQAGLTYGSKKALYE